MAGAAGDAQSHGAVLVPCPLSTIKMYVTLASAANVAAKIASKLLSRHFPTLDTHVFQLPDPREGLRVAGYVSLSDKRACGSDAAF